MLPDVGLGELLVIGLVALLLLKPEDVPVLTRKAGRLLGDAQRLLNELWPVQEVQEKSDTPPVRLKRRKASKDA